MASCSTDLVLHDALRGKKTMSSRFSLSYRTRSKLFPYLLTLPSLVPIAVILVFPIFQTAFMSLFQMTTMKSDQGVFHGLENYRILLSDPKIGTSLANTALLTVVTVLMSVALGLLLALALNHKLWGRGLFRSMIIIPWATPAVAAVLVWTWLMDYNFGLINYALRSLGFLSQNIGFLTTKQMAMPSLCFVMVWKYFSISCLMLLSGLQSIDTTLYEAARVDGASPFRQFLHITLPGLKSSGSVLVLLITIWSFREFTTVRLLTNGGPARATETLVLTTYTYAFNYYELGLASALGMVTFVLSLAFSVLYFLALRRGGDRHA